MGCGSELAVETDVDFEIEPQPNGHPDAVQLPREKCVVYVKGNTEANAEAVSRDVNTKPSLLFKQMLQDQVPKQLPKRAPGQTPQSAVRCCSIWRMPEIPSRGNVHLSRWKMGCLREILHHATFSRPITAEQYRRDKPQRLRILA
jgi:hypothetical protein